MNKDIFWRGKADCGEVGALSASFTTVLWIQTDAKFAWRVVAIDRSHGPNGFLHHPACLSAPSRSLLLLCSDSDPVTISRPFQRQILIWQHLLSDSTHLELGIRAQESDERDHSSMAVMEDICPWLLAEPLTFLCSESPCSFLIQESKMQDTSPKTIFCHTVVHTWSELESVGVAVLRMEALCVWQWDGPVNYGDYWWVAVSSQDILVGVALFGSPRLAFTQKKKKKTTALVLKRIFLRISYVNAIFPAFPPTSPYSLSLLLLHLSIHIHNNLLGLFSVACMCIF